MRALRPILLLILGLVALAAPARAEIGKLLTPQDLAPLVERHEVLVLDVRATSPVGGLSPYVAGHIQDAVASPAALWNGPAENPGLLPDEETLRKLVNDAGIDGSRPVVIVHEGKDAADLGGAARVYWTLKVVSVERVAILNGGMTAWRAAGLPVSSAPVAVTRADVRIDPESSLMATREEVEAQLATPEGERLIDARPEEFFWGKRWHDAAKRPGTIRGAENFPYTRWFVDGGPLIAGPEAARRIAAESGLDTAPVTIFFGNVGEGAAIDWFALSELAGMPGVKLYPGSMVDWSKADLPMDHVPGTIEMLWLSTRRWLATTF